MALAEHWNGRYRTIGAESVSWYQERPVVALELLDALGVTSSDSVIDIGGGASTLVDELLLAGYTDVTVLDVSAVALAEARTRLDDPTHVTWIEADLRVGSRRGAGTCGTTRGLALPRRRRRPRGVRRAASTRAPAGWCVRDLDLRRGRSDRVLRAPGAPLRVPTIWSACLVTSTSSRNGATTTRHPAASSNRSTGSPAGSSTHDDERLGTHRAVVLGSDVPAHSYRFKMPSRPTACEWCGVSLPVTRGPGRPAKFCCNAHRQHAYEARRRLTYADVGERRLGLPPVRAPRGSVDRGLSSGRPVAGPRVAVATRWGRQHL